MWLNLTGYLHPPKSVCKGMLLIYLSKVTEMGEFRQSVAALIRMAESGKLMDAIHQAGFGDITIRHFKIALRHWAMKPIDDFLTGLGTPLLQKSIRLKKAKCTPFLVPKV